MRKDRRVDCLCGLLFFTVLLIAGSSAPAQTLPTPTPAPTPTPTASPMPSLEKEFFKNILRDQKAIWTSPFHLDRGDAKWVVPSFMGTMALVTTDRITGD